MNISRQTAHKWWQRYLLEGAAGLVDRSSRPHSCPHQTPARVERRIVALRHARKLGPARLAGIVNVPASTVHRVLVRNGINRLRWMDRPTGRVIRRIETSRCGELVHIDVKKLARIPDGGGHRMLGRTTEVMGRAHRAKGGYTHIHTAIDAYSRLAYSEFAGIENADNCVAFLGRAVAWFADRGIVIERILTDNGTGYRSFAWRDLCAELAIKHSRKSPTTRPRTARSSGSTAPSPTSGPTPDSGNQNAAEPSPLTDSCIATTITDTTPPSAVHPPAASTTWQGRTASPRRARVRPRAGCRDPADDATSLAVVDRRHRYGARRVVGIVDHRRGRTVLRVPTCRAPARRAARRDARDDGRRRAQQSVRAERRSPRPGSDGAAACTASRLVP